MEEGGGRTADHIAVRLVQEAAGKGALVGSRGGDGWLLRKGQPPSSRERGQEEAVTAHLCPSL